MTHYLRLENATILVFSFFLNYLLIFIYPKVPTTFQKIRCNKTIREF
jgi:hypothetical protein